MSTAAFLQLSSGGWSGGGFTCGIVAAGTQHVDCWGYNTYGELNSPSDVGFMQISSSYNHSCGIVGTGTKYVQCWGGDEYGSSTPPGATVAGDMSTVAFVHVGSGYYFSCGILADGDSSQIRCWGYADYEQSTPPGSTYDAISYTSTASSVAFHFDESEQCEWPTGIYYM